MLVLQCCVANLPKSEWLQTKGFRSSTAEWSVLGCLLTPSWISTGPPYIEGLARTVGTASEAACSQSWLVALCCWRQPLAPPPVGFSTWPPRVLAARQPASPAAKEPGDRGGLCDAVSDSALELTRHPFCCILRSSVLTSCRRGFHKCGSLGPCVGAATID